MPTISLKRGTKIDLEVFEGNSIQFDMEFLNNSDVLQDISDWDFVWDFVAKDPHSHLHCGIQLTDAKFSMKKTLGDGLIISYIGTLSGNFICDLWKGHYKHNLVGTEPNGAVTTWVYGSLKNDETV